jgi:hypothetical protein
MLSGRYLPRARHVVLTLVMAGEASNRLHRLLRRSTDCGEWGELYRGRPERWRVVDVDSAG